MTPEKAAKIRSFIKGLFPYSYIIYRKEKGKDFFMLLEKEQKNPSIIPIEDSKFETVISVQGFGYSGSGAVLDLLREYPIEVLGFIDKYQGSKASAKESLAEIEVLRLAGGFFEMEKYLDSDNIFLNTAMLNRMVRLLETSALYSYSNEIKSYLVSFFNSLLDFSMLNLSVTYYNPYLTDYAEKSSILFLKKHSLQEFRNKCSNLLNVIFNRIDTDKHILAADQLCSDFELDFERNSEYVHNLKTILVARDPRDLYVWSKKIDCEWIAHDTVDSFIKWYQITYSKVAYEKSENHIVVRYEDLIWDYDNTVARIENYLGLSSLDHKNKFSCFDPNLSSKYTKLYKQYPEYSIDLKKIEVELAYHCNHNID